MKHSLLFNKSNTRMRRGFTLIEVTIALSILVMALSILVENQGFAAFMTRDAEKMRTATMLAEEKITEAQLILEFEGWTTRDVNEQGDFDDFGSEDFRGENLRLDMDDKLDEFKWAYTVRKIEVSIPTNVGGMMDNLMGEGYWGDQSENESVQNNQMDLSDIGISSDMITDYLSDYIREVRVKVWWNEDYEETGDYVELLTHVINPSGMVTDPEAETE
jgi:prepilin-type N-terminal cleavage/methylation domain-containing protein